MVRTSDLARCLLALLASAILVACATPTTSECALQDNPEDRYDCMVQTIFGEEGRAQRAGVASTVVSGLLSYGIGESRTILDGARRNAQLEAFLTQNDGSIDQGLDRYLTDKKSRLGTVNPQKLGGEIQADLAADNRRLANLERASSDLAALDKRQRDLDAGKFASELQAHQTKRIAVAGNVELATAIYQQALQRMSVDGDPLSRSLMSELQQRLAAFQRDRDEFQP